MFSIHQHYCLEAVSEGAGLAALAFFCLLFVLFADGAGAAVLPAAGAGGWLAGAFCAIASEVPTTNSVAIIIRFFRVTIILPLNA